MASREYDRPDTAATAATRVRSASRTAASVSTQAGTVIGEIHPLQRRANTRAAFSSPDALEAALRADIAATNAAPKPFIWTKTADEILASVKRFCQRTSRSEH